MVKLNLSFFFLLLTIVLSSCRSYHYQNPIDSGSETVHFINISKPDQNIQLYVIEDYNYWKTNSLFAITSQYVYLFSTGWNNKSARQILWKVKTLTFLPFRGLFLIAPSLEFSGGIYEFKNQKIEEIPIYIHKDGFMYLYRNWNTWQKKMKRTFLSWNYQPDLPTFSGLFDHTVEFENNILLFYPGEIVVPGNVVVYFVKEQVLFGGNLFFDPYEVSFPLHKKQILPWLRLISKLQTFPIQIIVAGKGTSIHSKKLLNKMKKFFNSKLRNF